MGQATVSLDNFWWNPGNSVRESETYRKKLQQGKTFGGCPNGADIVTL